MKPLDDKHESLSWRLNNAAEGCLSLGYDRGLYDLLKEAARSAIAPKKGWMILPDSANIAMHNAAAMAYQPPSIELNADGVLRMVPSAPDWSRVYRVMVDAAPQYVPSQSKP